MKSRGIWNALAVAALLLCASVAQAQITYSGGGGSGAGLFEEEFVSGSATTNLIGSMGWAFTCAGGTVAPVASEANRMGIFRLASAAAAQCSVYLGDSPTRGVLAGSQTATYRFTARFATDANIPKRRVGLNTLVAGDGTGDGVYFETLTDGNWFAVTNATSETRTDTGVAFAANTWFDFYITFTTGVASAVMRVNNTTLAAKATNFPSASVILPYLQIVGTGTAMTADFEYFSAKLPVK